eukprot:CAMPEP_0194276124 /NCGR_PEP_ID=MMETSP0169-20130528/8788_1 /TAXON_ID=218684 /ORGANISM="Corethron pennatum, Strain L29A3" /LENGTH=1165 /DNA_ID=CAMNT_0039019759 /DNA_START=336 /DNA_END=3833 /DNA_ORIENTATION=-
MVESYLNLCSNGAVDEDSLYLEDDDLLKYQENLQILKEHLSDMKRANVDVEELSWLTSVEKNQYVSMKARKRSSKEDEMKAIMQKYDTMQKYDKTENGIDTYNENFNDLQNVFEQMEDMMSVVTGLKRDKKELMLSLDQIKNKQFEDTLRQTDELITVSAENKKQTNKLENELEKLKKESKVDKEELMEIRKVFSDGCGPEKNRTGFQDQIQSHMSIAQKAQLLFQEIEDATTEKDISKKELENELCLKLEDMEKEHEVFKQKIEKEVFEKFENVRKEKDAFKQKLEQELEKDNVELMVAKNELHKLNVVFSDACAMKEDQEADCDSDDTTEMVKKAKNLLQEFKKIKRENNFDKQKLCIVERELNDVGRVLSSMDVHQENPINIEGSQFSNSLILVRARKLIQRYEDVNGKNIKLNQELNEFNKGLYIVHKMLSTNTNGETFNSNQEVNDSLKPVIVLIKNLKQDLEDANQQNITLDRDLICLKKVMVIVRRVSTNAYNSKQMNSFVFHGLSADQRDLVRTIMNLKRKSCELRNYSEDRDKNTISFLEGATDQQNACLDVDSLPNIDLSVEILNIFEKNELKANSVNPETYAVHSEHTINLLQEDLKKNWEDQNVLNLEKCNAIKLLLKEGIKEDAFDCETRRAHACTESGSKSYFETSKENEAKFDPEEDKSFTARKEDESFTASDLLLSFELSKKEWSPKKVDGDQNGNKSFTASDLIFSFENEKKLREESRIDNLNVRKNDVASEDNSSYEFTDTDFDLSFDLRKIIAKTKFQNDMPVNENDIFANSANLQSKLTRNSVNLQAKDTFTSTDLTTCFESSVLIEELKYAKKINDDKLRVTLASEYEPRTKRQISGEQNSSTDLVDRKTSKKYDDCRDETIHTRNNQANFRTPCNTSSSSKSDIYMRKYQDEKNTKNSIVPDICVTLPSKLAKKRSGIRKGLKDLFLGKIRSSEGMNAQNYSDHSHDTRTDKLKRTNRIVESNVTSGVREHPNERYNESRESCAQMRNRENINEERERVEEYVCDNTRIMNGFMKKDTECNGNGIRELKKKTSDDITTECDQFQSLKELRTFYTTLANIKEVTKSSSMKSITSDLRPVTRKEEQINRIKNDVRKVKQQQRYKNNRKFAAGRVVNEEQQNIFGRWFEMVQDNALTACSTQYTAE